MKKVNSLNSDFKILKKKKKTFVFVWPILLRDLYNFFFNIELEK